MSDFDVKIRKPNKPSMAKRRVQKFCKNPMSVIALIVLSALIFACVFAPLFTPHDPEEINVLNKLAPPSPEHPLGCDRLGRDLLARALYGGRWSLAIGILTSVCVNLIGASLGVIGGYFGGRIDSAIVTLSEFMSLFPTMLVIILIAAISEVTIVTLILIWSLTGWAGMMRMTRSKVASLKQEPFVERCVANGLPKFSIMFHHIIPNTTGPIIVNMTMNIAGYILAESSLSFLGYGLDSSIPTWGNLMNATTRIDQILSDPIQWMVPGACILILVLCVNFLGDGLRDAVDSTTR